ncbi:xylose isomerase [Litorilinea aerophila]|nr:xylose isomerase [Litorilinea aerophila]
MTARLSISTWSLHRTLGRPTPYGPGDAGPRPILSDGRSLALLELPARLAEFGIHTLEICHFHLPSLEPAYLDRLRQALEAAEIELFSLLIDAGDLSDPICQEQHMAWMAGWIDVASRLGARCARVSAGKAAPSPETLELSRQALQRLALYARSRQIRLMTENWHALLSTPTAVLHLLEALDGELGLCLDFGNWRGDHKYADLAAIAPRAESCHAKCHFSGPGEMDREDFVRCLDITRAAGFQGPYTLIYDGPDDDEWAGLEQERAVVAPYLTA